MLARIPRTGTAPNVAWAFVAAGLSSLDWTKALARRETRWRWASFNGYARVTIARITMVEQDGKRVEQATEGSWVAGERREKDGKKTGKKTAKKEDGFGFGSGRFMSAALILP